MNPINYLIIEFFIFSVAGWCIEVFLKYRQYGRFINRGFLIGPYCPIYGSGAVIITVMVGAVSGFESSIGTTFLISFIGCGILEYLVSYVMEKRFHMRWWDYSNKPMNLHGRIWIGNLVLFGIAGVVIIECINPFLYEILKGWPSSLLYTVSILIIVIMLADYAVSHFVMKFVKVSVETSEADSSEAISKEIRYLVSNKSILYKRIADAYPEAVYRTDRINRRLQEIKTEMARYESEAKENWELKRQAASENIELIKINPIEIKDKIIQTQEILINYLEDNSDHSKEITFLHREIEAKKSLLEDRKKLLQARHKGL